ncbi:MAG: VOC family protein [Planctomycetes bacterium]|nr:VOC family protein [Planctomycetota bacterium]
MDDAPTSKPASLELGAFSISLTVKDLAASRAFYEKLGFTPTSGDPAQNWQVLRNGDHVIGLFQGMFPKNMLTFNPGWDQQKQPLASFTDVRAIQQKLEAAGLALDAKADPASTGTAYLMLTDPDGNPVLIDQHVNKPR